ncbi:uncharacterized protein G2W53_003762 [Senna tora]|uniref:Uncharacterized protein n=1 Tax=Senna tora TaxID=362788 RepID=A0A834XAP5_9FABA|nr:uncharacterized protein G2W53_003762 [Senna tora]
MGEWVKGWKEIGVGLREGGFGFGEGWKGGLGSRFGREWVNGLGGKGLVLGLHDLVGEEERGSRFWWRKGNGFSLVGFGGVVENGVLGYGEEEERLEREKEG